MKRHVASFVGIFLAILPVHAASEPAEPPEKDVSQLSPEKLEMLDQRGFFTPAFKAAVHDLVDTRQALDEAKKEEKTLKSSLPDLQKQSTAAETQVADLRQELARYDHPEETDFAAMQGLMKNTAAKPDEQIALTQAYVWTYPASSHQAEAQQDLQQVQKKQADQQQADKDAAAARAAARAKLVQRAGAKDLKLDEWNDFLRDMSQEEVVKYLGRPKSSGRDYWLYTGTWTVDPYTGQKVGIEVNFNGTRVNAVSVGPPAP